MEKSISNLETDIPKDSFLLFLDLLGFSKRVMALDSPEDFKKLVTLIKIIKIEVDRLSQMGGWLQDLRGITFSDSIIFTVPFNSKHNGYDLAASLIIKIASFLQNALLRNGFLTRGYITRGLCYHDLDILFGPPLVKAYECEKKYIGNRPIVIVDPIIVESAKNSDFYLKKVLNEKGDIHILDRLKQDIDGQFYVDFLNDTQGLLEKLGIDRAQDLNHIVVVADKNIEDYKTDEKIVKKWTFLKDYASGCLLKQITPC